MMCAALRERIVRPWTLMIVQNEQENGQPRPASIVPLCAMTNRLCVRRDARGSGTSARSGGASRKS